MPLATGTRIGAYEVISLLGAGGMGEVYRARDSRLQRDVALKILPDHLVGDAERLARFQREAQVLASLAHANIAHIYSIEEAFLQAGIRARALVLELVEGPTLAERIAQGPIPVDEALPIAKQIAEALDAAHEQGIIHRDLKPANVKLREDGTVKVLDFGLAKLGSDSTDGSSFGGTLSPTLSVAFTGAGTILGTAAYMAPEQARGRKVDKRADVWAFGCVLFEMLAGTKAFDGTDATEMIAAVVRGEPAWSALPAGTPPNVVSLLRRCLQKDPRQRLRDIGDARYELEHAAVAVPDVPAIARSSKWRVIAWASGALLLAVAAALSAWLLKPEPERVVRRFEYVLPSDQQFSFPGRHMVAISSQGHIAYAANSQLYLRLRDQLVATLITGSGGGFANGARSPFFSPDGQSLGFYAGGLLKKVSITGGAPVPLTSAQNPWGATWGADNTILYGQGADGIYRVSGNAGKGERIIEVKPGESAHGPQMLPDGHTVLFTLAPQAIGAWNKANIVAHDLNSGKRTVVIEGGTDARYLATGHLVYSLNGSLLAAPFDASALRLTGGAVSLVDGVAQTPNGQTGAAQFSVTENGTLLYVPEIGSTQGTANRTLVWVDRNGQEEAIKGVTPRPYRYSRISHDGRRVAVDLLDENRDIGILSLALGTFTPLTFEPSLEQYVVWTPQDDRVIFSSSRQGVPNIYWQASNGSAQMQRLTDSPNPQLPHAITPDGSQLVFVEVTAMESDNLMIMSLSGDRKPKPLIATRFRERNAELSPNGRWLAYQSDKSGPDEIWVTPFPVAAGNGEWKLSTQGGSRPAWASDTELLYVEPTENGGRLMRVAVKETSGALEPLAPVFLAGLDPLVSLVTGRSFDVSKDGRILTVKSLPATNAQPQSIPRMILVQNWFEELKRRVPTR